MPKGDSGFAGRPRVNDIDQFGQNLSGDQRTEWMRNTLGLNEKDAQEQGNAINYFTVNYDDIHWGRDDYRNDMIDKAIANPNAPIFTGEQFRGLSLDGDNMPAGTTVRQFLQRILDTGEWKEAGATSFSASLHVAQDFAKTYISPGPNHVSVIVHYQGRTGMPIKHMSEFPHENEVLHSRRQMKNGYDIVEQHWENGVVHITIKDRKRK